jgi:hypothetical protein
MLGVEAGGWWQRGPGPSPGPHMQRNGFDTRHVQKEMPKDLTYKSMDEGSIPGMQYAKELT